MSLKDKYHSKFATEYREKVCKIILYLFEKKKLSSNIFLVDSKM
jgi:hypothetical protein